jgi:nucleolar protein 56
VKVSIVECVLGVLAFDGEHRLVESVLFPKSAGRAVEALAELSEGGIPDELTALLQKLRNRGVTELVLERADVARGVKDTGGMAVSVETPSLAGEFFRSDPARIAVENGCVHSRNEYYEVLQEVARGMARRGIHHASGRRDLLLSQAILTVDDLDKTFNLFANRVKEWYGLYFPELSSLVEGNEVYMQLIASLTERERFTEERLVEEGLPAERVDAIAEAAQTSMGADLDGKDLGEIQGLAVTLLQLHQLRTSLDAYIDRVMEEVAPNLRGLVGATLGARLIAFVGGLDNLAKRSSSKIQVLGAEKALFRSFRTGTKPPKHGLIFQHAAVHQAPWWQRGKIARVLAGKLAIAARLDVYRGTYQGKELVEAFETRVAEIQDKYAEPPQRTRSRGGERRR